MCKKNRYYHRANEPYKKAPIKNEQEAKAIGRLFARCTQAINTPQALLYQHESMFNEQKNGDRNHCVCRFKLIIFVHWRSLTVFVFIRRGSQAHHDLCGLLLYVRLAPVGVKQIHTYQFVQFCGAGSIYF
jgi:hypothetical protein